MNNYIIKIYDNIGSKFTQENNDLLIGASLSGFKTLSAQHCDSIVPYLIKNKESWETGLGLVKSLNDKIYVERIRIVRSSDNDNIIDFSNLNTEDNRFYVFANELNFNTRFTNSITVSESLILEPISATYLVDSNNDIELTLPSASNNPGLTLEFKTNASDKFCKLLLDNDQVLLLKDNYIRLISNGSEWVKLIHVIQEDGAVSVSGSSNSELFSSLADPAGNSGSLQYNNGGVLGEAPIYLGPNRKLLLGDVLESNSQAVLPTSGNYPTIFNNQNLASDFIVKGSGDKNLFFGHEGRLGLNIPVGARPQTSLHIVTNSCQEGVRLENRNQCYPANITLYHKPNTVIQPNSTIGTINLSSKNSSSNQVDYVQLLARSNSYTTNATKGEFAIKIEDSNNKIEALKINSSGTYINNPLYISSLKYNTPTNSGNILISDNSGNISLSPITNIPIYLSSLKYLETVSSGNLLMSDGSGNIILTTENNLDMPSLLSSGSFSIPITVSRILNNDHTEVNPKEINFDNLELIGSWKNNGKSILSEDTSSSSNNGYILTHTGSGISWKELNADNFIWSGQDIAWNKYSPKNCSIQNNGNLVSINSSDVDNEFSVGDLIKVSVSGTNYYTTISQISENSSFTNIILEDQIPVIGNATVVSISKGGYLDISVNASGYPNVAPQNIISARPGLDTSFNSRYDNIGFKVYGQNPAAPAIKVLSSGINANSSIAPVVINGNTPEVINLINNASLTVNGYLYTDYLKIGSSGVPNGYILTSVSGNLAEWKSASTINGLDGGIIVFNGDSL